MPRIPYANIEALHPKVREAYDALPVKLNIFRMMAHAERNFTALVRLGGTILGRQKLDDKLRELAILRVALLSDARYEWVQHVPIAERVGATRAMIEALEKDDIGAACFDADDKLVLEFTTESVRDVRPSDPIMERMNARFTPREIVELTLAIGYYRRIARLMETSGLDIDGPAGTAIVDNLGSLDLES